MDLPAAQRAAVRARLEANKALEDGDLAKALQHFENAATIMQSSRSLLNQLVQLSLKTRDMPRCQRYASELLEVNPRSALANQALGTYWLDRNEPERALPYLEMLAASKDARPACLNNLAWALHQLDRNTEAEQHCRRALEAAPDDPVVTDTLVRILLARNQNQAAFSHTEKMVSAASDQAGTILLAAERAVQQQEQIRAQPWLTHLLTLNTTLTTDQAARARQLLTSTHSP